MTPGDETIPHECRCEVCGQTMGKKGNMTAAQAINTIETTVPIAAASVKVMRSFDYCHFEVCLGANLEAGSLSISAVAVDELRKTAARLADKAVLQYQQAKAHASKRANSRYEKGALTEEVERILAKPEGDRTPNELAKVKALADEAFWTRRESEYDYNDDYYEPD